MKNNLISRAYYIAFAFFIFGCIGEKTPPSSRNQIPIVNHDLGYIPFDKRQDDPNYIVCDSTIIHSGRNRVQFTEGTKVLKEKVTSNFISSEVYNAFTGYVVVRFLVNCEGLSGRYRAQAMHLDFSFADAPASLIENSIQLIKGLDNWTKSPIYDPPREYSKFINLKITNGQIQKVLL